MKALIGIIILAFMMTACSPAHESAKLNTPYDRYDNHCQQHAEKADGSPDVETLYRECMDYFVGIDAHCPYCVIEPDTGK